MLKLDSIEVGYGKLNILKGITLEVSQGETVALIGANGAGKTTTLKAISGLVRTTKGSISFFGKELTKLASDARVRVGISHIPEGGQVYPQMSVWENLHMGAYILSDREQVERNLKTVFGCFPILEKRKQGLAGTLSGGQRQMLAIGRGLMSSPKFLMMDEPSLGLAPQVVQEVSSIIQQLSSTGVTILLVEQNANMALSLADRGYVLEVGRISLEGVAEDLRNNEHVKKAYLGG